MVSPKNAFQRFLSQSTSVVSFQGRKHGVKGQIIIFAFGRDFSDSPINVLDPDSLYKCILLNLDS